MGLQNIILDPYGRIVLKDISWNKLWRYEVDWVDFVWLRMAFFYADSDELFSTKKNNFDTLNSYFNNSWRWYITLTNTQLSGPRPSFYIKNQNIIFWEINNCPWHEEGSRSRFRNSVFYIGGWRKPTKLVIMLRWNSCRLLKDGFSIAISRVVECLLSYSLR
jgi:hypothetical protein